MSDLTPAVLIHGAAHFSCNLAANDHRVDGVAVHPTAGGLK
jgi:hypothetical protein